MDLTALSRRMREQLDLAIISIFGTIAALAVLGFAVYRFATDNVIGGLLDCGISLGLTAIVLYAWRTRDVARVGAVFVGFAALACVGTSLVFGRTATYWAFLVLSASFVVTRSRMAISCTAFVILAIGIQTDLFSSLVEQAIFVVTAALVALFSWIFNTRYSAQRGQLHALAHIDPLTQAGNRRAMRRALVDAIEQRRANSEPAVIAAMDLDHFKSINDRFGHEVGDRVLVEVAERVRDRLRRGDGFFRMGGEEFVVLLPATTLERGLGVVHELHRRIEESETEVGIPVTVSIGVACLDPDDDWSDWLRRADAALYEAKEAGRNRVVIDPVTDSGEAPAERRRTG